MRADPKCSPSNGPVPTLQDCQRSHIRRGISTWVHGLDGVEGGRGGQREGQRGQRHLLASEGQRAAVQAQAVVRLFRTPYVCDYND